MSKSDWKKTCFNHIGNSQRHMDKLSAYPARCMQATLDHQPTLTNGDPLPPLLHWLYFNEPVKTKELKLDGHPKLGSFLPPVQYPRRMWASSHIKFHHPLLIGHRTWRESKIMDVQFKEGASGSLCFVTLHHIYYQNNTECLDEQQTIVYRDSTSNPDVASNKINEQHDNNTGYPFFTPTILFRYSALTFNAHRIHYDRDYAHQEEGYSGLVVHGPLMATIMISQAMTSAPRNVPSTFSFRVQAPLYENERYQIHTTKTSNGQAIKLTKLTGTTVISAQLEWQS